MVTFAAIRLPGPSFKPQPGHTFRCVPCVRSRFLLHAHPGTSPQEPKMVPVPVPSSGTKKGLEVDRVHITPPQSMF